MMLTQRCEESSVDVCASSSSSKQSSPQWSVHTKRRTAQAPYPSLSSHCWLSWLSQDVGTLLCHSSPACASVWTVLSSHLLCCMGNLCSLGTKHWITQQISFNLSSALLLVLGRGCFNFVNCFTNLFTCILYDMLQFLICSIFFKFKPLPKHTHTHTHTHTTTHYSIQPTAPLLFCQFLQAGLGLIFVTVSIALLLLLLFSGQYLTNLSGWLLLTFNTCIG